MRNFALMKSINPATSFRPSVFPAAALLCLLISGCQQEAPGGQESPVTETPQTSSSRTDWTIFRGSPELSGSLTFGLTLPPVLEWSLPGNGKILNTPLVKDGLILLARENGRLELREAGDGKLKAETRLEAGVEASPLWLEDGIIVPTLEGLVVCLSPDLGREKWRTVLPARLAGSPNLVATPAGSRLVLGCYDHHLYALDPAEGQILWKFKTSSYINGAPAVLPGGLVAFGGCDGGLHLLDGADGRQAFGAKLKSYLAGSPAYRDGVLVSALYNGSVLAHSLPSLEPVWTTVLKEEPALVASPAWDGKRAVAGGRDGVVYALDGKSGEVLWQFEAGDEVESSPLILGDQVLAATTGGSVFLLEASTGTLLWSLETGDAFFSAPAWSEGRIYLGGRTGKLYCIGGRP